MADVPSVAKVGLPSETHDAPKLTATPPALRQKIQQVRHIFRTFSQLGGGVGGSMPGEHIDAYLNEFLATGWRIHSAHHVVNVPEGHTFCWCLIREM